MILIKCIGTIVCAVVIWAVSYFLLRKYNNKLNKHNERKIPETIATGRLV